MTDIEIAESASLAPMLSSNSPASPGDSRSDRSRSPHDVSTATTGRSGNPSTRPSSTTAESGEHREEIRLDARQDTPVRDSGSPVLSDQNMNSQSSAAGDHVGRQEERNTLGRLEHGIYWRSPFMMMVTAFLGVSACVGHGVFFMTMRGHHADPANQEVYIRSV